MNLYEQQIIKKIDEGFYSDDFYDRVLANIEHNKQNKNSSLTVFDLITDVSYECYIQGVIIGMTISGEIEGKYNNN